MSQWCRIALVCLVAGAFLFPLSSGSAEDFGRRHPEVLKLWGPCNSTVRPSVVTIHSQGKTVGLGCIVTDDGQILCKASHTLEPLKVTLWNEQQLAVHRIAFDARNDLALLELDEANSEKLQPVTWSKQKPEVGDLLSIPLAKTELPFSFGTYGAPPRRIPRLAPSLGLFVASSKQPLIVTDVVFNGPVSLAGVKKGDQLLKLGERTLNTKWDIGKVLRQHNAGDLLAVEVKRDGETLAFEAQLGESLATPSTRNASLADLFSPEKSPLDDWISRQRQPMMNRFGSGVSKRRSGFPAVSQHDAVVGPIHCGGPAVNLEGEVIGINIARAGRTDTLMIDAPEAQKLLKTLQNQAKSHN